MSSTTQHDKSAEESLISAISMIRQIKSIDGTDPSEKIAKSMIVEAASNFAEGGDIVTDPSKALAVIQKKLKDPAYRETVETYLTKRPGPQGDKSEIRKLIGRIADQDYTASEDAPKQYIDANISRASSESYQGMLSAVYYSEAFNRFSKNDFNGGEKMINAAYIAAGCFKATLHEDIFYKIAQIEERAQSNQGQFGDYFAAGKIGHMSGCGIKMEDPMLKCAHYLEHESFILAMHRAKEEEKLLNPSSIVAVDVNDETRKLVFTAGSIEPLLSIDANKKTETLITEALLHACNTNRNILNERPLERPPATVTSSPAAESLVGQRSKGEIIK